MDRKIRSDVKSWLRDVAEAYITDSIKDYTVLGLRERFGFSHNRAVVAAALLREGIYTTNSRVCEGHKRAWAKFVRDEVKPEDLNPKVDQDGDGLHLSYGGINDTSRSELVTNPEEMCRVANIDLEKWRVVRAKSNRWTTTLKGNDGEPRVVVNWQVKVDLEPIASALLRIPMIMEDVRLEPGERIVGDKEIAVFLGDPQIGHRWSDNHHRLLPTHDRKAMDLALQVCEQLQPDHIIFPGDNLDLAELSTKFPRAPGLWDTTQSALIECAWWLREFRNACPGSRIHWLNGNHEERLVRLLRERAPILETLADVEDGNAALDLGRLMHFAKLGVEDVGPYPEAELWLFDGQMRYHHGTTVKAKGGQTVSAVLAGATASEAFGHIHRQERAQKTIHGPLGPRVVDAISPGCLCSVTGDTPGVSSRPDWQQGVLVTTNYKDTSLLDHELVSIERGRCAFRGTVLLARDVKDVLAEATGLRM
jgi:hypothetical protein